MLSVLSQPRALYAMGAEGLSLQVGLAAMEEGDDRYRAGGALDLSWHAYSARGFYFEQNFGPVKRSTYLVEFTRSLVLPPIQMFAARVGLAPLLERTQLHYQASKDQAFNRNEYEWNVGLAFGIFWQFHDQGRLRFQVAWDSVIFPAGLNGGILLATARKNLLTLSAGMKL